MLQASRRAYKRGQYLSRSPLSSYPSRPSPHLEKARHLYGVENMTPTKKLAQQTGCSVDALKQIIRKGEGAYFSSGSRPSQTAQSWGLARLASSITGGKAAAVDFSILEKGCDHKKKAYRLAHQYRKKNKHGQRRIRKISI